MEVYYILSKDMIIVLVENLLLVIKNIFLLPQLSIILYIILI